MGALIAAGLRDHRARTAAPRRLTDRQLEALALPVLVLLGGDSPVHDVRKAAERARRLVPRGRVEIVPGAGHGLFLDRPDEVGAALLSFLRDADDG
jgi:pimeloyl-ACP methyl ester carboxylesterase